MSKTHAERLREMAVARKPYDAFLGSVADALDKLAQVEIAAFEAYDCLGGEDEMREILARICEPSTLSAKERD